MSRPASKTGMSNKALRQFAFRVLKSAKGELIEAETTDEELMFFCETLSTVQLADIYGMFYRTGLVR